MDSDRKMRVARIIGFFCLAAGTLNLAVVALLFIQGQRLPASAVLVTGLVALSGGIFMLALAKQKPPSGS